MISFYSISPYILEIVWPAEVSEKTLAEKISFKSLIKNEYSLLIKDCVSGYHNLSLLFHKPYEKSTEVSKLLSLYKKVDMSKGVESELWKIPVYYNGKDLESYSTALRLSIDDVIKFHTSEKYRVHFYGFIPGFLYLGGLDSRLHLPRKENPDRTVPAGSVAVGGKQTGIYPFESPGGWHVIGSCPIKMFDPHSTPAVWANEGDRIQFYSVGQKEYNNMKLLGTGLIKGSDNG